MKKILFFLVLTFFCVKGTSAQLVHAKGDMAVGLGFNYIQGGYNASAKYNYLVTNRFGIKGSVIYEKKAFEFSQLSLVFMEADALYTFKRYGNSWFFNIGVGVFSSYEMSNSTIFNNYRKLSFGESLTLSIDYYINHRFIVDIAVKQRIHQLSEFGQFSWYSGIGVNYKF
jgi:hypothetical protein